MNVISKTINFSDIISSLVSNFGVVILGLIGLALIIFAIYIKKRDLNFRKNGAPVELKVKKVEELSRSNGDGKKIFKGYRTTFEFYYNDKIREEVLTTEKKFKVNSIKKGIYLTSSKRNVLSVAGEGFYLAKGGEIFLISFGLLMLFLAAYFLIDFSPKIVICVVLIFFIFFGIFYFSSAFVKHPKHKKNKIDEIYYSDVDNDEYSTVDKSLVRYIPKAKKAEKAKAPFGLIFAVILFIGLGGTMFSLGVAFSYKALKIRFTYQSVMGEISDTYTYKSDKSELTGVVYNYEIDGKNYRLDYKASKGSAFSTYEIGNKVRLYYEEDSPDNAIPKSELGIEAVPLVFGMMFICIGVYFIADYRKKAKIYKTYVMMKDKKI